MSKVPQKKVFSIERNRAKAAGERPAASRNSRAAGAPLGDRHDELMALLSEIRDTLAGLGPGAAAAPASVMQAMPAMSTELLEQYRSEMEASANMKAEIKELSAAIARTKKEITSLRTGGGDEVPIDTATTQLDAVVKATELATNTILNNVEEVETIAIRLYENAQDDDDREMAEDIKLHVIRIMEACNFQDITGQRITKVVKTLKFVDERISRMMEIWGEEFEELAEEGAAEAADEALLNGPQLDEDERVSQAEIDAMFE